MEKETLMRKLMILLLAIAITACGAPPATPTEAPTEVVVQPTQTALVVVETVVVEISSTPLPTDLPTATPLPPTPIPPTAVPPTQAVAAPTEAPAGGPISVDNTLGAGWFVDMTRSGNELALRCRLYSELTFYVKTTDPNITMVDFFYRVVDKTTGTAFDWQSGGRLIPDGTGGFSITFSGESVHANYRRPSAWLDYQFAGSNNTGVIGRSEKIEKQINYMFDCP
jgi:hypothetical protein